MIRTNTRALLTAALILACVYVLGIALVFGPYLRAHFFCRGHGGVASVETHGDQITATCKAGFLATWERK